MTAPRAPDAGFTLIETLVALAVLAISAVALLATTQAHITRIAGLEARAAATWAAENHLAEITLGLEPADTPPPML
ncbi:MAG: type II secretion system minor pseudopilin GspI, partial [Paracoccaceae bacterium]